MEGRLYEVAVIGGASTPAGSSPLGSRVWFGREPPAEPNVKNLSRLMTSLLGASLLPLLSPGCGDDEDSGSGGARVACDYDQAFMHYCNEFIGPPVKPEDTGCTQGGGKIVDQCPPGDVGTCETSFGNLTYRSYFYPPVSSSIVESVCPDGQFTPNGDGGFLETGGRSGNTGGAGSGGKATGGRTGTGGTSSSGGASSGGTSSGGTGGTAGAGGAVEPPGGDKGPPVSIGAHGEDGCALFTDGSIECWGYNLNNKLCDPIDPRDRPIVASDGNGGRLTGARSIAVGYQHSCILIADGTAKCCGANGSRQLGKPTTGGGSTGQPITALTGEVVTGIESVHPGYEHTCTLMNDGTAYCFGQDAYSQRGSPSTLFGVDLPVAFEGAPLTGLTQLSTDVYHSCALGAEGSVYCWGANSSGELGTGNADTTHRDFAVRALDSLGVPLSGMTQVEVGFSHTCVLVDDGTVRCWGRNSRGQLGIGTIATQSPVLVPTTVLTPDGEPLGGVRAISASIYHTCALLADETVACWGSNEAGQLGLGTVEDSPHARVVPGLEGVVQVSAGGTSNRGEHTCALQKTGVIQCWGSNSNGRLGSTTFTGPSSSSPVVVDVL